MGSKDPGEFGKKDTDLGKFSHGNFDVKYQPIDAALWVTLRVRYKFRGGISEAEQRSLKQRFTDAVSQWDGAGACLRTNNPDALNPTIWLRFVTVESPSYNKVVDVKRGRDRDWVGREINISESTTTFTLTHELGHVWGNYDEYKADGVWGFLFEQHMYWHDNKHLSDKSAVMNEGSDFRLRYFDHFERYVNSKFRPLGIKYSLQFGSKTVVGSAK